jgi:L-arabinose transport system substrate-binding protein
MRAFLFRRFSAAFAALALACLVAGCGRSTAVADNPAPAPVPIKIGFLVKQPDEPWFQLEWKFAEEAARDFGFELIKIGATDGEKVLAAIDRLAADGAQGFVICTPDVRLGPEIVRRAKAARLKLLTVDDQLVDEAGRPLVGVPYLSIPGTRIGDQVGRALAGELRRRGWPAAETGVCVVTFDELDTGRQRTEGAAAALVAAGVAPDRIFRTPQRTLDAPGSFAAVGALLARQSAVKYWLVCGVNDSSVLGAVRALEGAGFGEGNAVGVGINGTECVGELEKEQPTAFFGSILLPAKTHGYESAAMMYHWIRAGVEPPIDTRTTGLLITRENFRRVREEQGIQE